MIPYGIIIIAAVIVMVFWRKAMCELADRYMSERECPACKGARLKPEALAVRVGPWGIRDMSGMAIERLASELEGLSLEARHAQIAAPVLKEIRQRLRFLKGVGLGYLTLARSAGTLSGGEAQRIRLASQIDSGLAGVTMTTNDAVSDIRKHLRDACCQYILLEESYSRNAVDRKSVV